MGGADVKLTSLPPDRRLPPSFLPSFTLPLPSLPLHFSMSTHYLFFLKSIFEFEVWSLFSEAKKSWILFKVRIGWYPKCLRSEDPLYNLKWKAFQRWCKEGGLILFSQKLADFLLFSTRNATSQLQPSLAIKPCWMVSSVLGALTSLMSQPLLLELAAVMFTALIPKSWLGMWMSFYGFSLWANGHNEPETHDNKYSFSHHIDHRQRSGGAASSLGDSGTLWWR